MEKMKLTFEQKDSLANALYELFEKKFPDSMPADFLIMLSISTVSIIDKELQKRAYKKII